MAAPKKRRWGLIGAVLFLGIDVIMHFLGMGSDDIVPPGIPDGTEQTSPR
jgi:hypothetical protein